MCPESANGFLQLTTFDQTDGVFVGLQSAIQPAQLLTSWLTRGVEAALCSALCSALCWTELARRRDVVPKSALGLSLSQLVNPLPLKANETVQGPGFGRAKNLIWLYMSGGPSQYETFNPKPNAPAEIRGIFNPIATSVPDIQICELLPRVAEDCR